MNRKDYFKKRDRIIDKFNACKISLGERNALLAKLSMYYRPEWGNRLNEVMSA